MAERLQWLLQKPADDVATALVDLATGAEIIGLVDGDVSISLVQPIPFGHKFAIRDLKAGTLVRKYGQVIGMATKDIRAGEHVHVHNLASCRGRGDLAQGGAAV